MDINNYGKGAVKDTPDARDYQLSDIAGGHLTVDWTKEVRLPVPPDTDQANADCCVGEAWSSYHWQLKGKRFSVRSVFAYIALAYGAEIRQGGLRIKNFGQEDYTEAPDPEPKTPSNMRSKVGLNPDQAIDDKEYDTFVVNQGDIDGVAWAIDNYKGVVFGVYGSNPGWADMTNPRPPMQGESVWGHALYAMGHHTHSDGQKCIIAKSSWCKTTKEHHIREFYFTALTGTMNAWTLIPKEETMTFKTVKVKVNGANGVAVVTPNMINITLAEDEEEWRSYNKPDSYRVKTVNADGTTNWDVEQEFNL